MMLQLVVTKEYRDPWVTRVIKDLNLQVRLVHKVLFNQPRQEDHKVQEVHKVTKDHLELHLLGTLDHRVQRVQEARRVIRDRPEAYLHRKVHRAQGVHKVRFLPILADHRVLLEGSVQVHRELRVLLDHRVTRDH